MANPVRNLCLDYPRSALSSPACSPATDPHSTSSSNKSPLVIYLTARSSSRGNDALSTLTSDPQLRAAGVLRQDGGPVEVRFKKLDVVERGSVEGFAAWMRQEHSSGVDIIVNNAGVALDGVNAGNTHMTLQTNYHAPLELTTHILPLIRLRAGRVVTLSSLVGKLTPQKFSPSIRQRFLSATSIAEITTLLDEYQESMNAGTWAQDGWPVSAYAVSKAGITGAMGVIGREELGRKDREQPVLVNTCCPGYVITDMTKKRGRKTPDQGSWTPVKLALGDIGNVGGQFWEHEEVSKWDS